MTKLRKGGEVRAANPALATDLSATLCQQLLAQINELRSGDDAALWAHRSMVRKNALTADDARQVEDHFSLKLTRFTAPIEDRPARENALSAEAETLTDELTGPHPDPKRIDKAVLALPEPRRIRDRAHVRSIVRHSCLVCGRTPSDAHHLRFTQKRALGRKVSDEFTIPLCRGHHRELHRHGDEAAWWKKLGLDPVAAARTLWLELHPLPERTETMSNLNADPSTAAQGMHTFE